jgi:hypothetical protein
MAQSQRSAIGLTVAPAYGQSAAITGYTTIASSAITVGNINISTNCTPSQWINMAGGGSGGSIIYNYDVAECQGQHLDVKDGKLVVPKGRDLLLPDGTVLHIDDLGNVRIDDANAKVIYQASRMREFNPYINASDLLASFIRYLGTLGLGRSDAGQIPVALFINWLVIEAATRDGDPIPDDVLPLPAHPFLQQRLPRQVA